jgi:hypothetical protein
MFNNRARGVEGVVEALKSQHEQIRTVFFHVMGAQGQDRQRAFLVARQLLALHEVIEEEIVHPAARVALVSGPSIVADRHKEEERALVMISELEQFDVDSHEFTTRFRTLQLAVTAHAEAEEAAELSTLAQRTGADDAADLLARFRMAQQVDATRLSGSFHAMMDEVRDQLELLERAG